MSKIFNPLFINRGKKPSRFRISLSSPAASPLVSESALFNEVVGTCPKCETQMSTSTIANNDQVFFCTKCRVALPRPNSI